MSRKHVTFIVAGLLGLILALAATFVGRGHFGAAIIAIGLVFYVGLPLGIVGLVALLLGKWRFGGKLKWVGIIALAGAEVLTIQLISLPLGFALQERDVAKARAYCESLIDGLEAHRERTGSYPEDLGEIQPKSTQLPRLLGKGEFYSGHGDSFSFEFMVPDGLLPAIHVYDSADGNWTTYS